MSISVIALFVLGLLLIVWGADKLVDGASAIARRSGVSEFVIGLTIVGFGTSCPELVVSLTGALEGNADISLGNVIGSNIFNTLLILGITALMSPIVISKTNLRKDIPVVLAATVLLIVLGCAGQDINRIDAGVFLLVFVLYLAWCFRCGPQEQEAGPNDKPMSIFTSILYIILGLVGLVVGGRFFVDNAVIIASALGVSDKVIAITLLAGGTSLPELVTCVIAGIKKHQQLALGNILGSNLFNILLILGCSAMVTPLSFAGISGIDLGVLLGSMLLLLLFAWTGPKSGRPAAHAQDALPQSLLGRGEGAIFVLLWLGYTVWLIAG